MISAILLTAGQSKRMNGENKLTKEIQGIPLIKHSVKNILFSYVNELIVVLGYQKEIVEKLIGKNKKMKIVFNKNFENGMASSIKTGLNHFSEKTEAFFICLGDMPLVNHNIYNQLIESKDNKEIIDNAISGADLPPNLIPIGPKTLLICSPLNPDSLSLSHLFAWVFLLPRAPM